MGYNNDGATRLVFDVETAPLEDVASYMGEVPIEAPANYKDPVKIAAYVAAARAEQLDRCALDVDLCRIVAIGWWRECDRDVTLHVNLEERTMLNAFWNHAEDSHLVGFNCLGFDLPVLLRRSLYLGVETPRVQIDRFKHPKVTDLMDELSYAGKLKARGLAFYCKRFGIDVPDGVQGAQIGALVAAGEWEQVKSHCLADVQRTAFLAARLGHFTMMPETSEVL
jgi:predicted PolB exonuclease-like 3'-5' exonuclease